MAEEFSKDGGADSIAAPSRAVPPVSASGGGLGLQEAIQSVIEKVPDQQVKALLQVALSSRTSFGMGPDPETAKILAESEMHAEKCRLEAYRSSLQNRDKQSDRDHDYRKRKLNRSFA